MSIKADTVVIERRLRPIYEWLSTSNNKKALQECEKVLKKTPNLSCAKALKALTLNRMGKNEECKVILDTIFNEKPTDELTLEAVTLCYIESQDLLKICKIYENAIQKDPSNEELLTQLFIAYGRICDFKSQHQTAVTLYKLKPKSPYYCWAVISIVLQATRGAESTNRQKRWLLLTLAERMMEKLISENKMDTEEEVQVYIKVLENLDKYQEILKIFDNDLGAKLKTVDISEKKMYYLSKLKKWRELNLICKSILNININKWNVWKEYVNSVLKLMFNNSEDNNLEDSVDNSPERAFKFISDIIGANTNQSMLLRGPYLARFELCNKLQESKLEIPKQEVNLPDLFIQYFRNFGHKPFCVSDIGLYLQLLNQRQLSELALDFLIEVGIMSNNLPHLLEEIQRHICALQLSRLAGSHKHLSANDLRTLINDLWKHHENLNPFFEDLLRVSSLATSDAYVLMSVHVLYDLAEKEKNSDPVLTAITMLEKILIRSPVNLPAKLLLIRLYHVIGAGACANKIYNTLDVKHLQLDSLGYIHCARLPATGLFSLCKTLSDSTLRFFTSNKKEDTDVVSLVYRYGSFGKLEEIMDFKERIYNSLHYATVAVDTIMLNLMECNSLEGMYGLNLFPKDKINWESICDNNDYGVTTSWDPGNVGPPENWQETKILFQQNVRFLKLRTFMLSCIRSARDLVKFRNKPKEDHLDDLKIALTCWRELHAETTVDRCQTLKKNFLILPLPSRLQTNIDSQSLPVLTAFLELLIYVSDNSDNLKGLPKFINDIEYKLDSSIRFLRDRIAMFANLFGKRKFLELAVNCVEASSLAALICLLCNEMLKPRQPKKGKTKPNELTGKENVSCIAEKLKRSMQEICSIMQEWITTVRVDNTAGTVDMLNIGSNQDVLRDVLSSYDAANKEMQAVLGNKIKMLEGVME